MPGMCAPGVLTYEIPEGRYRYERHNGASWQIAVIETLKLRVEMMTGIGSLAAGFSRGESRSPGMTRQSTLNRRMKLHDLHCYNKAISVLLEA